MAPAVEPTYIVEEILGFRLNEIDNDPDDINYDETLDKKINVVQYYVKWADYDESWNSWEPKLCFEPWTTDYDKTINKLLSNDLNLIHPNILDEQAATLNEIARKKFKRKKEAQALAKLNAKAKGKEVASKKQSTRNESIQPSSINPTSTSMNKQTGRSTQNSAVSNYKLEEFALNKPDQLTPSLKDLLPDKPPPRRDSNGQLISSSSSLSQSINSKSKSRTVTPIILKSEIIENNKKRIRDESQEEEDDDSFADEEPVVKPVTKKNKGKQRAIVEDSDEEEEQEKEKEESKVEEKEDEDEDEGFADDDTTATVEVRIDKGKGRERPLSKEVEVEEEDDDSDGFADGDDDHIMHSTPIPLPSPIPQDTRLPAKSIETPKEFAVAQDDDDDSEGFADEGEGDPITINKNKIKQLPSFKNSVLPSPSANTISPLPLPKPSSSSNSQLSTIRKEISPVDSDDGFADEMDTNEEEVVINKPTAAPGEEQDEGDSSEGFADDDAAALKNPRISTTLKQLPRSTAPPPPRPPPKPQSYINAHASTIPKQPAPPMKPIMKAVPPPPRPPPRPASRPLLSSKVVPPPPAPPVRPASMLVTQSRNLVTQQDQTQEEEDDDEGFADDDPDDNDEEGELSSNFADDDIEEEDTNNNVVGGSNKSNVDVTPRITTDQLSKLQNLRIPRFNNATSNTPIASSSTLSSPKISVPSPTIPSPTIPSPTTASASAPIRPPLPPVRPLVTSRLPPSNNNSNNNNSTSGALPKPKPPPPAPPRRPASYGPLPSGSTSTSNARILPPVAVPPRVNSNLPILPPPSRPTPPPPAPPAVPVASTSSMNASQKVNSSKPKPVDPFNNGVQRRESKDGYIILKDDVLYQKFRQTDLARRIISSSHKNFIGTEEEIVINTLSKLKTYWKIGNPFLNFFNFKMGIKTNQVKECWIYAPLKDSKELSKKKKILDDYIGLQLLLASMNDGASRENEIRQTENLRIGSTRAIFIHASEKSKIGKSEELKELNKFRNKKGIIFVIFGGDDPDCMFLQFWNPLGTLVITPQAFVDEPAMMKSFVEQGRDSVRNFHHRDVFPWAPLSYLTKDGRFGASHGEDWVRKKASTDFQGIKAFHESIVSDSLCLVHPFREIGETDKRYFPGPHDMEEYSTVAFTALEGYLNIIGPQKGTDIEFLQRQVLRLQPGYLHIRRWIILGTDEEIESASEYPGVEIMNAEEVREWLALTSDEL